jgi:hypothetical protein
MNAREALIKLEWLTQWVECILELKKTWYYLNETSKLVSSSSNIPIDSSSLSKLCFFHCTSEFIEKLFPRDVCTASQFVSEENHSKVMQIHSSEENRYLHTIQRCFSFQLASIHKIPCLKNFQSFYTFSRYQISLSTSKSLCLLLRWRKFIDFFL